MSSSSSHVAARAPRIVRASVAQTTSAAAALGLDLGAEALQRLDPKRIEEAIAELPAVSEVAVVGIADDVLGQVPKAFVVLREAASPAHEMAIKAHCRARLAPYKIPRFVEFVDALPRTASGKVRRVALTPPMATAA